MLWCTYSILGREECTDSFVQAVGIMSLKVQLNIYKELEDKRKEQKIIKKEREDWIQELYDREYKQKIKIIVAAYHSSQ